MNKVEPSKAVFLPLLLLAIFGLYLMPGSLAQDCAERRLAESSVILGNC